MNGAWIRVEESRDRTPEGAYKARFLVAQAYAVPQALFVMRTDDGGYSHVAVVDDALSLPDDRDAAVRDERPFFRAPEVEITALTREALLALTTHVRRRLREVTEAWDAGAEELAVPGTDTFTFGSDA